MWANINLFPSWLLHLVRPYGGTAERISIASISASGTTARRHLAPPPSAL
jgi:hypothetical protein